MILEIEKDSPKRMNDDITTPRRRPDGVPSIDNSSARHFP